MRASVLSTVRHLAGAWGPDLLLLLLIVLPWHAQYAPVQSPTFLNSLGMTMVRVPAPPGGRSYYLGATEVTNSQFESFRPDHRERRTEHSPGDDHPVVWVSWDDAARFARWLSYREGRRYRLPTETQWHWAASVGGAHRYGTSEGSFRPGALNAAGVQGEDVYRYSAPVASFPPNAWGLHDMSGNVWEWCDAWYYLDPTWHRVWLASRRFGGFRIPFVWYALREKWRVLRGGSYVHAEPLQRLDVRNGYRPSTRSRSYGFRLACDSS